MKIIIALLLAALAACTINPHQLEPSDKERSVNAKGQLK